MLSNTPGPLVVSRQGSPSLGNPVLLVQDSNPDLAPSLFDIGAGAPDARYGFLNGATATAVNATGFWSNGDYLVVSQVPSTISTTNIAAAANPTSGTAMALVATTGAGITVTSAATTITPTGNVVPAGALAIDLAPANLTFGQNGSVVISDPRLQISRAVSVTGVAGGTGGTVLIKGADVWGVPMSQLLTVTAGAATSKTTKAFKFIYSVTPQFTDSHGISVGTTDTYGFPLRADGWESVTVYWAGGGLTANTGFTAPDTTTPATTTTGDPRGTYATQSASDGTKKLVMSVNIPPWQAPLLTGWFGVVEA